ncbi:hypothetical protein [Candidatus Nitrotoga arctica]|uniref:hypothetical protein n=1 Tax=Candidatus Nitrotoga arctica TaxID=453162 RepID=UPI001EFB34F3|nr:hypothetical protein [Candidatus Nitrotoga arctica]
MSPKIPDPTDMSGLPYAEAHMRLQAERMNKLPPTRCRDIPTIALEMVRELLKLIRRH